MAASRAIGRPRVSLIHSNTMIGAAIAATRSIQGKPNQMAANNSGPSTTADSTRVSRPRNRPVSAPETLAVDTAVPAFASTELGDRLLQMILAEIRPQRVDEHQLGVRT